MTLSPNQFLQAAWIVNDLEQAVERWLKTTRVGPFFIIPHVSVENALYRGTPTTIDFSGALAQAGPMQIELIQQHSDTPSAYRDTFAPGQEGFHHVCGFIEDFDAEVEHYRQQDSPLAFEGAFGDMRFGYVDTRASVGFMTEVIEDRDSIRQMFKMVADAAIDWDGADPIRTL
ncbi:MAG: VOC family protein [Proteobacteria bacterium]|nr:VOC family protein [Pseudomonadota bacterium]